VHTHKKKKKKRERKEKERRKRKGKKEGNKRTFPEKYVELVIRSPCHV